MTFLWSDRFVRLQLAVFAVVGSFYVFPIVSPESLNTFSRFWLCVPFMIVPLIGCASGIDALPADERGAWRTILAGLACWFVALVLTGFWPENRWNQAENGVLTGLYLAYYLCILLAIDAMPRDGAQYESALEHRIRRYGVVVFVTGWVIYLVILPAFFGQRFTGQQTSDAPASIVLGLATVARALVWRYQSESRRWRVISLAVAIACLTLVCTDVINLLLAVDFVDISDGRWTDFIWALPSFAFLAAFRLRHAPFATAPSTVPADPESLERTPIGLAVYLMCGGLSFPLTHWLLHLTGVVSYSGRAANALVDVTVIVVAAAMMGLAMAAHWRLETSRSEMRRERRHLQEQLSRSNKMEALGRLAGGVAHDFNNILTVIGGTAELAMNRTPPGDPNRDLLQQCREAANRAAALTRQLLVFSRRQVAETVVLDLNEVITSMSSLLQQLIGEQVEVVLALESGLPHVRMNRGHFEQVLLNLAANARDAMPRGGVLTISTTRSGTFIAVSVRDTGHGIAPDAQAHIFEPFFTTKTDDGSRGIGLATVYGIVKQHGGDISVESAPDTGTCFTFQLPASSEAAAPGESSTAASAPGGGELVLLVEDNVDVRRIVHAFLTSRHYYVLEAASGPEAISLFGQFRGKINLVLTDVVMPQMSGVELVSYLQGLDPALRVLYMSGYPDEELVRQGLSAASVDFIQKPFSMDVLARRVRRALDAPPH